MTTITTKFSVGQRAYYVIYANASVNPVDVLKIYPSNSDLLYDVRKADSTGLLLKRVPETDLMTFPEARTALITYLQLKLTETINLVAP
jgi:hypothetical protein